MLRITEISEDDKTVKLRLDGRIVEAWVSDLEEICIHYRDEKRKTVVLDLSGVTFIDSRGVTMLEKMKDGRLKIVNCSLFIEALLNSLMISNQGQK
jgi:anti-anti-sigma regulatory factor